jgi:predicted flap endonuclease-1-like 5' DNA nuclease
MPEITIIHIALLTLAVGVGVVAGWVLRGNRCAEEKIAVNTGWQEQLQAQRTEHERLQGQNQSLMEQVNQNQASGKDATHRAKELSGALKEAFERRDELQREIKDVRNTLESAVGERDKLQATMESHSETDDSLSAALRDKDEQIAMLANDLENWRDRLPPLIERYRVRNEEAEQLEADLVEARDRIEALEAMLDSDATHIVLGATHDSTDATHVEPDSISDGLDASNDPDDADAFSGEMLAADDILEENDDVDGIIDSDDETHIEEHSFDAEPVNDAPNDDADSSQSDADTRDDLKQIKGIGPAIEKTLNELGIIRLRQIADMSEYDIDRVAKRLKGFRSRIYREDWIGQARDLHNRQASEQA